MELNYLVEQADSKTRLDTYIEKTHKEYTRSHYKKLIEDGQVKVNGKVVTKAGYSLSVNDNVNVNILPPKEISLKPAQMNLDIVYQDQDLAVINKPQGLVVHPAAGNYDNTLVNGLLYTIDNLSGINGEIRPGIVHRIDKDTSGLLLVAKNDKAHVELSKQIQNKTCKRHYMALLQGVLKKDSGVITTNIARDKKNRLKMAVCAENEGKYAETHFNVITRFNNYTLVEFELKTGRTHQIRVHANYINHPVVGDALYNPTKNKFNLNGQLLHAYKLSFVHPTSGKETVFEIKLPTYFEQVLRELS